MMDTLKKYLLGTVAVIGLSATLSAEPAIGPVRQPCAGKPQAPSLAQGFNSAAKTGFGILGDYSVSRPPLPVDVMIEGNREDADVLCRIVRRAWETPEGRGLFARNDMSAWRIGFLKGYRVYLSLAGEADYEKEAVFLHPLLGPKEAPGVLVHEMTHVDQKRLGMWEWGENTPENAMLKYKMNEAAARAVEAGAMWGMGSAAWKIFRDRDGDMASAWETAYAANPLLATEAARVAVFDAFFGSDLCAIYETRVASALSARQAQARKSGGKFSLPDADGYNEAAFIASLTLNGVPGLERHIAGFSPHSLRYAGVSDEVRAVLARTFPEVAKESLPRIRPDAPRVKKSGIMKRGDENEFNPWIFLLFAGSLAGLVHGLKRREEEKAKAEMEEMARLRHKLSGLRPQM